MDLKEISENQKHRHPWETARMSFFKEILVAIPFSVVLDIGSGDAWLAKKLVGKQKKLYCFDPNYTDEIIGKLQSKDHNIDFVKTKPKKVFDLVLLMDVLEHIENDAQFLKSITNENLTETSHCLISVPAWQYLYSSHDKYLHHYRRYSPESARKLIEQAGLKEIRSGMIFFLPWIVRCAQKLVKQNSDADKSNLTGWTKGVKLTNLTRFLLEIDAKTCTILSKLGVSLPGLSWWCLCKRSNPN